MMESQQLTLAEFFRALTIGLYRSGAGGDAQLQREVDPTTVLEAGDYLALSGSEEALLILEKHLAEGTDQDE